MACTRSGGTTRWPSSGHWEETLRRQNCSFYGRELELVGPDLSIYFPPVRRLLIAITIGFVHGPYANSRKEPDFNLRADGDPLPRFVIELGWNGCYNRLLHDMNLWLVGGNDSVQAVLFLKWKYVTTANKVSGVAELYGLDRDGVSTLVQTGVMSFPLPTGLMSTMKH